MNRNWAAIRTSFRNFITDPGRGIPLLLGLLFLALYMATAVKGFVVGWIAENDSAEIQRAVVYLGIIHPTGYPGYTLLAHAFTRIGVLLGDDPLTWVTYFSSFTAALAIVFVYLMLREWFQPVAALFGASIVGVSGVMWHIATITEVQGLHVLTVAAILYLAVRFYRTPDNVVLLELIALLVGLGLSNHRLIVLIGPGVALILLRRYPWRKLGVWGHVRLAAMVSLPLLSYYYIFYSAAGTSLYGETPTVYELGTVYDHINSPYKALEVVVGFGQMGVLTEPETVDQFLDQFEKVFDYHVEFMTLSGVILGAIGLLLFARRAPVFCAAFVLILGVHWGFFMVWRIEKGFIYYAPTVMMLGVGLAELAERALASVPQVSAQIPRRMPVIVLLIALVGGLFALNWDDYNRSDDRRGDAIFSTFAGLPANAVVFTGGYGPEHFIGLEAQRDGGEFEMDTSVELDRIVSRGRAVRYNVYLAFRTQQLIGMIDGALPLPERGVALSGTFTDWLQVHRHNDPRLQQEANQARMVDQPVTDSIRLHSYRATFEEVGIHLTLYWAVTGPVDANYHPYTHLREVDANGTIIALLAQRDYPHPVRGMYPTRYWRPGDVVRDTYIIPWPDDSLPEDDALRLAFGLTNDAGERLGDVSVPFAETDHRPE